MQSIFSRSKEQEEKKAVIIQMNNKLNENLNKTYEENYSALRATLIEKGFSAEEADEEMKKVKAEVQKEMMVSAQKMLKEKLQKYTQTNATSDDTNAPLDTTIKPL